ncbi:hypothetical protein [Xenorhabdus bovienii]|uniref:hypothetical protein n=1 Tax=Xenorhabdus bovienii TaxID=40576 RepID=UPI0023B35336|nr:hypothetical protein [Xenorhabdus bovienii]MDE9544117.1 hypothetical protein [Xenorhabdus bovienii]
MSRSVSHKKFNDLLLIVSERNKKAVKAFYIVISGYLIAMLYCWLAYPIELLQMFGFLGFILMLIVLMGTHAYFITFNDEVKLKYDALSNDEINKIEHFAILKRSDVDNNLIIDYYNEKLI